MAFDCRQGLKLNKMITATFIRENETYAVWLIAYGGESEYHQYPRDYTQQMIEDLLN